MPTQWLVHRLFLGPELVLVATDLDTHVRIKCKWDRHEIQTFPTREARRAALRDEVNGAHKNAAPRTTQRRRMEVATLHGRSRKTE